MQAQAGRAFGGREGLKVNGMTSRLLAVVAAATMLTLGGCANMDRQTAGTIGGAAVGGVVGNSVFGGPLGTLGGAAAGGYIGNKATEPNR